MFKNRHNRDSQYSKVWKAIHAWEDIPGNDLRVSSSVRTYANRICIQPWFIEMFPYIVRVKVYLPKRKITISLAQQNTNPSVMILEIPKTPISVRDVLWCFATFLNPNVGHNPEWCLTFLFLVKKVVGPKACGQLTEQFRKYRVNYGPGNAPVEETLHNLRITNSAMKLYPDDFRPSEKKIVIKPDKFKQGFAHALALVMSRIGTDGARGLLDENGFSFRNLLEAGADEEDLLAIKIGRSPD